MVVNGEALADDLLGGDSPRSITRPDQQACTFDASHQIVVDEGQPGRAIDPDRLGERVVKTAATDEPHVGAAVHHHGASAPRE